MSQLREWLKKSLENDDLRAFCRLDCCTSPRARRQYEDDHGNSLLHSAAGWGALRIGAWLLEQAETELNTLSTRGWSPIVEGQYWAQEFALKAEAESRPQIAEWFKQKAADCLQMVTMLKDRGAVEIGEADTISSKWRRQETGKKDAHKHNHANDQGRLKGAAIHDNLATMQQLIGKLAAPSLFQKVDKDGNTVLHCAAEWGSNACLELLLKHMKRRMMLEHINTENARGWSAITSAKYWAQESALKGDGAKATACLKAVALLKDAGGVSTAEPDTKASQLRRKANKANVVTLAISDDAVGPWDSISSLEPEPRPNAVNPADKPYDWSKTLSDGRSLRSRKQLDSQCQDHVRGKSSLAVDSVSRSSEIGSAISESSFFSIISAVSDTSADIGDEATKRCWLPDVFFKLANGNGSKKASFLEKGDLVMAEDGTSIEVAEITVHPPEIVTIAHLRADDAVLEVTDSHRVVTIRNGRKQTQPAKHLELGDKVNCSQGKMIDLDEISRKKMFTSVVQISFKPDKAVEVFNKSVDEACCILSKGHRTGARRSRQSRGRTLYPATDDSFEPN